MASKFQMVDPSKGDDLMQVMASQVNDRLQKAVDDLENKHAQGNASQDSSVDGPTGVAYRAAQVDDARRQREAERRVREAEEKAAEEAREQQVIQQLEAQGLSDDEDEDLDGDAELLQLREKRLNQLKAAHKEKMENLTKGHGQYREISQDEFLPEVTSSRNVVCHFYHNEFMRCKIMDKHLALLAPRHVETKFVKINAEKAPFFVGKLQIRTLPTVALFLDGVAQHQIQGFEPFTGRMPEDKVDEFPTSMLARYMAQHGMIEYTAADETRKSSGASRSSITAGLNVYGDGDEDLSD